MTLDSLSYVAGAVLSLLFAHVPGLSDWYASQTKRGKAGLMAAMLIVVSVSVFALSCAGLGADIGLTLYCSRADAIGLLTKALIPALVANQATFQLMVEPWQGRKPAPAPSIKR
jgi:hypothetical protein